MTRKTTTEETVSIANHAADLLEREELNGRTAALLHRDDLPHLNNAVDDYVRAVRHLETKKRALENELIRIEEESAL